MLPPSSLASSVSPFPLCLEWRARRGASHQGTSCWHWGVGAAVPAPGDARPAGADCGWAGAVGSPHGPGLVRYPARGGGCGDSRPQAPCQPRRPQCHRQQQGAGCLRALPDWGCVRSVIPSVWRRRSSRCSPDVAHRQRVGHWGWGWGGGGAHSPAEPLAWHLQKQPSSSLPVPGVDLLFLTIRSSASALSAAGSKRCCRATFYQGE